MNRVALVLLLVLCLSCKKDEVVQPIQLPDATGQDNDRVTGFTMLDNQGANIQTFGNPNSKLGGERAFPVPVDDNMYVNGPDNILTMWILPATAIVEDQAVNFDSLLMDHIYSENALNDLAIIAALPADSSAATAFDTSALSDGYYKFFYKRTDGEIFSQNIHVQHDVPNFLTYIAEMNDFWN